MLPRAYPRKKHVFSQRRPSTLNTTTFNNINNEDIRFQGDGATSNGVQAAMHAPCAALQAAAALSNA